MSSWHCAFCDKHGAERRVECNPPDKATQVFRHFCNLMCQANWETNQPRKQKPFGSDLFG